MGFWDLLPLGIAAVLLYVTTTWLAKVLLRRVRGGSSKQGVPSAERRQGDRRQGDRRQADRRAAAAQVEATARNKAVAKKEEVVAFAKRSQEQAQRRPMPVAPVAPAVAAAPAAKPAKERIESLDFTVAEAAAIVEAAGEALPVVPSAVARTEAENVGLTLVLDTAELMRSIQGKAPPPPPPETPPAANDPAPIDWAAALNGLTPGSAEPAKPAFFEAPQAGAPTLDLTQPVSLASARAATLLPESPLVPAAALETTQSLSLADTKPEIAGPVIDLYVDADPELRVVHTSETFRAFAVAHDDIQTARSAFEELMTLRRSVADPVHRALIFGACAAYARPFLGKPGQAPTLAGEWANFTDRPQAEAHIEMLLMRSRLLDGSDPDDEEIVVVGDGEDEEDGRFAIRSTAFRMDRVPVYIEACKALEARLQEHLTELADETERDAA